MAGHDPGRTGCSPYLGSEQPVVVWRADFSSEKIGAIINDEESKRDSYLIATEPVLDSEENTILGLSQPYMLSDHDVVFNRASVVSLRPDGTENWRFDFGEASLGTPAVSLAGVISVPVGDNTGNQDMWGLSPEGHLRWKKPTNCRWPGPLALVPELAFAFEEQESCTVVSLTTRDYVQLDCGSFKLGARPASLAFSSSAGSYRLPRFDWGRSFRRTQFAVSPRYSALLPGADKRLYSVTPWGELSWASGDEAYLYSGTCCAEDGTVYAAGWQTGDASGSGRLFAWDGAGQLKFAAPLPRIPRGSCLAIGASGTLFIAIPGSPLLLALAPDGREIWRRDLGDGIDTGLTVDAGDNLYLGTERGFWSLDATGRDRWFWAAADEVKSTPVIGRRGTVYVGLSQSLVALGTAPEYTSRHQQRNPR